MLRRIRSRLRPLFSRLEAFGFACIRRILYCRARDVTASLSAKRVLVVAPHQDDETLGAGVAVMRLVEQGAEVHITVVTDGRNSHTSAKITKDQLAELRRQEMIDACGLLGVPPERVHFGPCEDRYVGDHRDKAYTHLRSLAEKVKPDLVISPSPLDRHYDHVAVGETIRRLAAEGVINAPVYEYPVWFYSVRTWTNPDRLSPKNIFHLFWKPARAAFTLPVVVVRTSGYLDRKRKALEAHRSQMFNLTGEPTWLTLPEDWLTNFFRAYEMFFPLPEAQRRAAAPRTEAAHA
ncbi:MAG: PIG-L family deacetylase [Phycisphaeraceae bacterium]|nr:PIG-L family deacetylase [Phycisphaeraceae bacterium]